MKHFGYAPLFLLLIANTSLHADRRGGPPQDGGDHGHHEPSNFNPAPQYNYYNWESEPPNVYPAPYVEPHPYQPANPYRSLYEGSSTPPGMPNYPEISHLPVFALINDTPIIHEGEEIKLSVTPSSGIPPYTVFWRYDNEPDWVEGSTAFNQKAKQRGIVTISAIVKDSWGNISVPQATQVVVLKNPG